MKKIFIVSLVCLMVCGLSLAASVESSVSTVDAIIKQANTLPTVKAKADYLIAEAKKFYSAKNFQPVIDLCKYVLQNVDKNSVQAKNLLDKAKAQLQAAAQKAVGDVTSKFGTIIK